MYKRDYAGQKQQVAGLALIGQGTLSIMWSIHREGAVQLISLDKE